ncbi:MAG: molecular chaperone [Candidatus Competibacterales bacterium]
MTDPAPGEASDDSLRQATYALLAALLRTPPDAAMKARLGAIEAEDPQLPGLPGAWAALKEAAQQLDVAAVDREYHKLFIGLGRGELVPYGSWYQTGFLMEKPLALLRQDLAALGIARQDQVAEPEDHAAFLCEVMALLGNDCDLSLHQARFFDRHLAPWLDRFFKDLQRAETARFYRAVGRLGEAFFALEQRYLAMPV